MRLGKKMGVDDYLVKPVSVDDLVIAIENKLQRMLKWKRSTERQVELARSSSLSASHGLNASATSSLFAETNMPAILEELEVMPNEFSHKAWEALQKCSTKAIQLVRQIGLLLQLDHGTLTQLVKQNTNTFDVIDCMEIAVSIVRADFDLDECKIGLQGASAPMMIPGSPEIMIVILSEIIKNAVIFSDPSAPVTVTVKLQQDYVIIEVIDQGIGIPENHLPFIWERFAQFYQTDYPQQGVGLGLAIVNECVGLCNGVVSITSQPQAGTVVKLSLPRS
jgi:signal transduction histidine kinase